MPNEKSIYTILLFPSKESNWSHTFKIEGESVANELAKELKARNPEGKIIGPFAGHYTTTTDHA